MSECKSRSYSWSTPTPVKVFVLFSPQTLSGLIIMIYRIIVIMIVIIIIFVIIMIIDRLSSHICSHQGAK